MRESRCKPFPLDPDQTVAGKRAAAHSQKAKKRSLPPSRQAGRKRLTENASRGTQRPPSDLTTHIDSRPTTQLEQSLRLQSRNLARPTNGERLASLRQSATIARRRTDPRDRTDRRVDET